MNLQPGRALVQVIEKGNRLKHLVDEGTLLCVREVRCGKCGQQGHYKTTCSTWVLVSWCCYDVAVKFNIWCLHYPSFPKRLFSKPLFYRRHHHHISHAVLMRPERPKRQYNVLASTAILLRVCIDISIIGDHLLYFGGLISQTIAATYRLNLSKLHGYPPR